MNIIPYRLTTEYASTAERQRLRGMLYHLTMSLKLSKAAAAAWMLWLTTTAADMSSAGLNRAVQRGKSEMSDFIKTLTKAIQLGGGFRYILIGQNGTSATIVLPDNQFYRWQLKEALPEDNFYKFTEVDIREFSQLIGKKVRSPQLN